MIVLLLQWLAVARENKSGSATARQHGEVSQCCCEKLRRPGAMMEHCVKRFLGCWFAPHARIYLDERTGLARAVSAG